MYLPSLPLCFSPCTLLSILSLGNNGSAFIEVLVGKSSGGEDYQVLLVASSFMSPAESKSWSNTNRVRMFGEWYKNVAECLKNKINCDWLCENRSMDYYSNSEQLLPLIVRYLASMGTKPMKLAIYKKK